ncbi:MAG: phosphopantetheine-binding protein [Bacteroidota bacterium]|nr:phosphopantetheine-binding protein [Bacteroidota bacterium]MDP4216640.1 phosphopantetheine-binding protein [Bacteroidota bacterium]MDP4245743.1 phosphopantetheine-binding protein [Bacteroidota bacterium]MDP4255175.1 phosphopantetheine-binding protein [Bacteroidota bacterium]MDP4260703.1 phosphopantetheine-binding protein [Bacteroidota bacterium]
MTEAEISEIVIKALKQIAPDMDPEKLHPDDNIREKLEIDSFDALRLLVELDEKFGIETPEEDYGKIRTMKGLVDYIMQAPRK